LSAGSSHAERSRAGGSSGARRARERFFPVTLSHAAGTGTSWDAAPRRLPHAPHRPLEASSWLRGRVRQAFLKVEQGRSSSRRARTASIPCGSVRRERLGSSPLPALHASTPSRPRRKRDDDESSRGARREAWQQGRGRPLGRGGGRRKRRRTAERASPPARNRRTALRDVAAQALQQTDNVLRMLRSSSTMSTASRGASQARCPPPLCAPPWLTFVSSRPLEYTGGTETMRAARIAACKIPQFACELHDLGGVRACRHHRQGLPATSRRRWTPLDPQLLRDRSRSRRFAPPASSGSSGPARQAQRPGGSAAVPPHLAGGVPAWSSRRGRLSSSAYGPQERSRTSRDTYLAVFLAAATRSRC